MGGEGAKREISGIKEVQCKPFQNVFKGIKGSNPVGPLALKVPYFHTTLIMRGLLTLGCLKR